MISRAPEMEELIGYIQYVMLFEFKNNKNVIVQVFLAKPETDGQTFIGVFHTFSLTN